MYLKDRKRSEKILKERKKTKRENKREAKRAGRGIDKF